MKAKYPSRGDRQETRGAWRYRFPARVLLQVVPEEGQDVHPEDIHYYDGPPFDDGNHLAHGVHLAISTKESGDYTAIVSAEVTWPNGQLGIFV